MSCAPGMELMQTPPGDVYGGRYNYCVVSFLGFVSQAKLVGSRVYSSEEEKMMTPRRNAALGQGNGQAPLLLIFSMSSQHVVTPARQPPPPLPNSPVSRSSFSTAPQAPHVCSLCVCSAAVGMWGEKTAKPAASLRGGDQLFLALFLNSVQQAHIHAPRSSCLDEYLPKSLCYLAVSLQKGPAPFVW